MSRVFITGVTGLAGGHLAELLVKNGHDVYGIDQDESSVAQLGGIGAQICFHECDVQDTMGIQNVVKGIQPDMIFHLAAITSIPASWQQARATYEVNILGTLNVLEAARQSKCRPLVHIPGSSAEYGMVHEHENPVSEQAPLCPLSPYGVSKIAQDMMGYQYYMNYGLHVLRTRAFNNTGPRADASSVCSAFAKQIAEVEKNRIPPIIRVGNLDARRDFTDVRDVVRAYWLALEHGVAGEVYNVCSGTSYAARQVLDMLLELSSERHIEVVSDPDRLRPSDVPLLVGDFSKIRQQTGWEPRIPFDKTLRDLLDYWRTQVE